LNSKRKELQELYERVSSFLDEPSRLVTEILRSEIDRRKKAGRKASGVSRKEQNRLAQQRFRDKKKALTSR
jgi:hypothetical protein